jgi:hypothetical protein
MRAPFGLRLDCRAIPTGSPNYPKEVPVMAHPSPEDSRANWAHLYEGLQASTVNFYAMVEGAVANRSIPDVAMERIEYSEGGALSDKRQYLRVRRRRDVFDICGAPFGDGFFFSWWLAELRPSLPSVVAVLIVFGYLAIAGWFVDKVGIFAGPVTLLFLTPLVLFFMSRLGNQDADDFIMSLPLLGSLYRKFFRPITYYRIDTSEMFQQAVRTAVMEVIDQMTAAKGIRALTEMERKPVMREFAKV